MVVKLEINERAERLNREALLGGNKLQAPHSANWSCENGTVD